MHRIEERDDRALCVLSKRRMVLRRNSFLYNKIIQFHYEHRILSQTTERVRKSAEEVNKMLNKMSKKEEKNEKQKK